MFVLGWCTDPVIKQMHMLLHYAHALNTVSRWEDKDDVVGNLHTHIFYKLCIPFKSFWLNIVRTSGLSFNIQFKKKREGRFE